MSADAHMGRAMTDSTPQHEVAETKSQPVTTPTAQARQLPGDIPPASTPAAAVSPMTINTAAVSTTTLSAAGSQAHGNTIQILPAAGNYNAENTYGPKSLVVKKGTTVTWVNTDPAMVHNLADQKGSFQSKLLKMDESWSYRFRKAGVYHYYCLPHPWMKGEIIIR